MFQGNAADKMLNDAPLSFDPTKIDFVLLTHAHIDHSGRIPLLVKKGFKGKIYTHKATMDLCEIMLPDSGYIQETETEWVNRKRIRSGLPLIEPLYTYMDAQKSLGSFSPVSYNEMISPAPGIRVCFKDAGHILGSSIIEIWIKHGDVETKTVFTGDLGKQNTAIIRDPSIIEEADWLVMESTYGDRLHTEVEGRSDKMANIIARTVRRGGNVLIPAFSVGRTQEMIYDINKRIAQSEYFRSIINNTKTFVDSPLAINATAIFMENPQCYDMEAKTFLESGDDPLQFPGLTFTMSPDESKEINNLDKPCIIIAASGMCDAGRIKHHLKHNLWRPESSVVFVGYQAQGSLGRRILDGNKKVKIFGESIDVNANIESIDGFSAHADQNELLNWVSNFKKKPKKIFIVHGDPDAQIEFSKLLESRLNIDTVIPDRGDSYDLTADQSVYYGVTQENKDLNNEFKRLRLLDRLYEADEEISSMVSDVYDLLKTDISDMDVERLLQMSKEIEASIKEFKSAF